MELLSTSANSAGGRVSAWQTYLQWNASICATVFPEDLRGRPAYLDMDDAVLESIGTSLGIAPEDAREAFLVAVRDTVDLRAPREEVFAVHVRQLAAWRRRVRDWRGASSVEPPPTVALLAAFTLAAEAMGSDTTVAVHAYYPRLAAVLGAAGKHDKEKLTAAYQAAAEQLWRSLNDWLALADGRFGIPTAYALTHRYVGLPLSQALIRDGDRRRLLQMFQQFGLPPGSVMTPGDMERVIDTWMAQSPCPASKNFQGLWQRSGARERIAEVATAELAAWDNLLDDEAGVERAARAGSAQLVAQFRRYPRPLMQLSFVASLSGVSDLEQIRVLSADGKPSLEVLALGGSQFRPRSSVGLDAESLVAGVLHVSDLERQIEAKRYPRRVVPMRKDETSGTYVECERVQLGEDFAVLVKKDGDLVKRVVSLLDAAARPGFAVKTAMAGLPAGWTLVSDVQMLTTPSTTETRNVELNALAPLVKSHLSVAGGLKLPGSLRKWSTYCPPEIRAVSQLGGELRVALSRIDIASGEEIAEQTWVSSEGAILVDLADEDLTDGDYELRLSGEGEALQRFVLRLRSSDTPDGWTWSSAPALRYDQRAPAAALTATPLEDAEETSVELLRGNASAQADKRLEKIWWKTPQTTVRQIIPIVIEAPEPGSCVVTGAHHINVPTVMPNRPEPPFQVGECRYCGLTRRYPTRFKKSRTRSYWNDEQQIDLSSRPKVASVKDDAIGADDALDALVHVGGGTANSLERVLAQVNSSALEVDALRRSLEALGHVEVRRSPALDVVSWQIAPPRLLETTASSFFVAGAWSRGALGELQSAVERHDGVLTFFDEQAGGLTSWYVEGLPVESLQDLLPALAEHLPMGMQPMVVRQAAAQLVGALPPLSAVAGALPKTPLPGAQKISRLDLETASWRPVQSAVTPGAYRMESGYRSQYIFRSSDDVSRREAVVCSVQLAKHLEAQRSGRPYVGHFPSAEQLVVPLGADLPVLYGRAATLCSGRLPTDLPSKYTTVYHEVPRDIAVSLHALLSN